MKKIIILILAIIFWSCDPGTEFYVYVKNNCSYPITVITTREHYNTKPTTETMTAYVLPNENHFGLIEKGLVLDTPPELNFLQLYAFSTITITNKGGDTAKKDYMNLSLWEFRTNKRGLNYDAFFYYLVKG